MTPLPRLLIPIRSLRTGKTRLSPVLSAHQRFELGLLFLHHLRAVAADFSGLQRTLIVTRCAETARLAQDLGLPVSLNPLAPELNAELMAARERCLAEAVLVVPADLPCVSAKALQGMLTLAAEGGAAIAPDKARAGTNGLLLPPRTRFDFRFGRDSFSLHQAEFRRHGMRCVTVFDQRLAFDIDTPEDLARWQALRARRLPTYRQPARRGSSPN